MIYYYFYILYKIKYILIEFNCNNSIISLPTMQICLSLSYTIALRIYRANMSVLVALCCSPCLTHRYVCPCRTLLLSLSNDTRKGKQQCAKRTSFDLLKKKFNFLHTRYSRTKRTWKESEKPNFKDAYKKVGKLFRLIRFFS